MAKNIEYTYYTKNIDGVDRTIRCWTTDTRCGFCHHAQMSYGGEPLTARVSYINRTYESFRYETCIKRLLDKLPKRDRELYKKRFIEKQCKEEHERCEAFVSAFKAEHDKLPQSQKDILAKNAPMMESEEQAQAMLNTMRMMNVFNTLLT